MAPWVQYPAPGIASGACVVFRGIGTGPFLLTVLRYTPGFEVMSSAEDLVGESCHAQQHATNQGPGRSPSLLGVGLALVGVGRLVEGAVTGTASEQRFPNAALVAFLVMLAGGGLLLLGYRRQPTGAGLPPKPAFFLWATLIASW